MQIQPISISLPNSNLRLKKQKQNNEPLLQPNFKGLKGMLTGGAVGAGLTAGGVAIIAGAAALPLFVGYIAVNGAVSALTGHFIENKNKKD